jgi:hypothetical protein
MRTASLRTGGRAGVPRMAGGATRSARRTQAPDRAAVPLPVSSRSGRGTAATTPPVLSRAGQGRLSARSDLRP